MVRDYSLKFAQSARYALNIVADSISRKSKFISGVSSVVKVCRTAILIKEMDLSRFMVHDQQIEEQKLKDRERENKRDKLGSFNFFETRSKGGNRSQFLPEIFSSNFIFD